MIGDMTSLLLIAAFRPFSNPPLFLESLLLYLCHRLYTMPISLFLLRSKPQGSSSFPLPNLVTHFHSYTLNLLKINNCISQLPVSHFLHPVNSYLYPTFCTLLSVTCIPLSAPCCHLILYSTFMSLPSFHYSLPPQCPHFSPYPTKI
jgi:hypothetical protein